MATRRRVLGSTHVNRAVAATTDFDRAFQELVTASAWGRVWSRGTISFRERSMITIALLAALGHSEELAMHIGATRNTGASADDIAEVLLHVAIYAGAPAANHAISIAKEILAEEDGTPNA
ncbi:MAG: 4-carboxymuconolactone decarboxylase [Rhodobacteraceae bacterium]|nr:4-carboxymuconolactone decarboxylase [Paracoccaceae bacterium]